MNEEIIEKFKAKVGEENFQAILDMYYLKKLEEKNIIALTYEQICSIRELANLILRDKLMNMNNKKQIQKLFKKLNKEKNKLLKIYDDIKC